MKTKFINLPSLINERAKPKKELKKTVFTHYLDIDKIVCNNSIEQPKKWENVVWIGYDVSYGDVFKVWNDDDPNNFTIYFGTKGDEFNL